MSEKIGDITPLDDSHRFECPNCRRPLDECDEDDRCDEIATRIDSLSSEELSDIDQSLSDIKEGKFKVFDNVEELFTELDSE